MTYNVIFGTGPGSKVVKERLSKSQAQSYCDKENEKFYQVQVNLRLNQNTTPPRRDRCILYTIEKIEN